MHLIIHTKDGVKRPIEANAGEPIIDALKAAGETVIAPCGGAGTCGRCRILVRDNQGVSYRLACQTPAEDGQEIVLEDLGAMRVEGAQRAATAAFAPGEETPQAVRCGLAIDIGTTTMAFHLVNLNDKSLLASIGKVNPQVTFGSDVIARIEAAEKPSGMGALCDSLRKTIDQATDEVCRNASIPPGSIESIAIVGNTVMEHFATGLDPRPIGVSPFTPASLFGCEMKLHGPLDARDKQAYLAPAIAGYVGGDITAGLQACDMSEKERLQLFIDIGTNGEMALGNRESMICCATAAGPAFEGASIAFGMPALPGAVCAVELDGCALSIKTIDDEAPLGICGSGLLDAVACLLEAEIIDETGALATKDEAPEGFSSWLGTEQDQAVCYLDASKSVYLTQNDVRQVQLAKAALRAGVETMLDEMQATCDDVEELALAGGFGMRLNPVSAARIGLFPPELQNRVRQLGNAAGQGAVSALFPEGRSAIERIAAACTYLELSTCKAFNTHYVDAMGFDE